MNAPARPWEKNRETESAPPLYLRCIHCGLCTSSCPTYLELGSEPDSPRGRIHLIRALDEGRLAWDASVADHLESCLDCQACVTACPSGVEYGRLIESAREQIETGRRRPWRHRLLLRVLRDGLFPYRRRMRWALQPLRLLARSRILSRLPGWLPGALGRMGRLVPASLLQARPVSEAAAQLRRGRLTPEAAGAGDEPVKGRVLLLTGCVGGALFEHVNEATAWVLAHNGYETLAPAAQGCCGALHHHTGARRSAQDHARRLIDAFVAAAGPGGLESVDAIVVNAAGCGSTMKQYAELLADDPSYAAIARKVQEKVRDIHEFLDRIELKPPGLLPVRVAYHDACHLIHGQKISEEPRRLLRRIPGLELAPLAESDVCCGSAGIYNITHGEMADRLQRRKLRHIQETGASIVASANPGCTLQILSGAEKAGLPLQVAHPVELLRWAYTGSLPEMKESPPESV